MTENTERPVFVASSPRSGSTLLRLILDAHPQLAVPPPAWLTHFIYPYLYSYGDLSTEANLAEMIEDSLATPTIRAWPISPSAQEVRDEMREPTFAEMYAALHRLYAQSEGKERWGEKTPRVSFYMEDLKAMYPGAQFVHIIRDGRDVAIDIADSALWPNNLYATAAVWRDFVESINESAETLGPDSFYVVRYEELCAEPEPVLEKLCEFLGEDFSPAMLAHQETTSTKQWAETPIHAKTARPITTDFVEMYKHRLPESDVGVIESLIGETLGEFGYALTGAPDNLSSREKRQLMENDTVTNIQAVEYKRWHDGRRKERCERGVWKQEDRDSLLWGFH